VVAVRCNVVEKGEKNTQLTAVYPGVIGETGWCWGRCTAPSVTPRLILEMEVLIVMWMRIIH